jgi:hypothetical protein
VRRIWGEEKTREEDKKEPKEELRKGGKKRKNLEKGEVTGKSSMTRVENFYSY